MAETTPRSALFTPDVLGASMTYKQYLELTDDLLAEGKTTGPKQSEKLTEYTQLNRKRMDRLDKTVTLSEELTSALKNLKQPMLWVVLTEAWCGDAAQNIPPLVTMAEATPQVDIRFLLRDEHPQLIEAFPTDGGKGIPKLIALNADTLDVLGEWGPRPEPAQNMVRAEKAKEEMDYPRLVEDLQRWYNQDKTATQQAEMLSKLRAWEG